MCMCVTDISISGCIYWLPWRLRGCSLLHLWDQLRKWSSRSSFTTHLVSHLVTHLVPGLTWSLVSPDDSPHHSSHLVTHLVTLLVTCLTWWLTWSLVSSLVSPGDSPGHSSRHLSHLVTYLVTRLTWWFICSFVSWWLTCSLITSDFQFDVTLSRWWPWRRFTQTSAATWWMLTLCLQHVYCLCISPCQFLIYSTFILVVERSLFAVLPGSVITHQ